VNSTVTWINKDSSSHTATSFDSKFDSGYLSESQQYTFKFISAGIYRYRCSLHGTMRGTITVLSKQGTTSDPTPTPSSSNEGGNPPPANYNYY
jgi:plastocyanin domain-containing protein